MFSPKYAPNVLHGVGDKLAYVVIHTWYHVVNVHLLKFLLYLNLVRMKMKVFIRRRHEHWRFPATDCVVSDFLGLRPTESRISMFLCVLALSVRPE